MQLFPSSTRPAAGGSVAGTRRGVAVVEMAVVLPVLFMLIIGAIEFGRAVMVTNVLTTAAREGARAGVVPGSNNTEVTTNIHNMLTSAGLPASQATIVIKVNGTVANVSTAKTGDTVSVNVTMAYGDVAWLATPFILNKTDILGAE